MQFCRHVCLYVGIRSLELKLQMFMSHHGNRIWFSARTSVFHHLSQLFSSPLFYWKQFFFFERRTLYYLALACLELAISGWPWIHRDLLCPIMSGWIFDVFILYHFLIVCNSEVKLKAASRRYILARVMIQRVRYTYTPTHIHTCLYTHTYSTHKEVELHVSEIKSTCFLLLQGTCIWLLAPTWLMASVTPVPGNLVPFSCFCRHSIQVVHIHIWFRG